MAFPSTLEALGACDAVVLSDIGSNTLLLHPDTWAKSQRTPNRLNLIRDFVRAGGGLMMVGGYYSFQGINGGARYRGTAVEDVLPVEIMPYDSDIGPHWLPPEFIEWAEYGRLWKQVLAWVSKGAR